VNKVAAFYKHKRDTAVKLARLHLGDRVAFNEPSAGMFLWLELKGVEDTKDLIKSKAIAKKVLLLPGGEFLPDGGKSSHVRASFSTATEEEMNEAFRRLGELLSENN
jgi:kynurenine/2-aminoadipate aminotransferase